MSKKRESIDDYLDRMVEEGPLKQNYIDLHRQRDDLKQRLDGLIACLNIQLRHLMEKDGRDNDWFTPRQQIKDELKRAISRAKGEI